MFYKDHYAYIYPSKLKGVRAWSCTLQFDSFHGQTAGQGKEHIVPGQLAVPNNASYSSGISLSQGQFPVDKLNIFYLFLESKRVQQHTPGYSMPAGLSQRIAAGEFDLLL